jgi:predicted nucleotidyltransferase
MQLSKPFKTITPTLDGDILAVLARQDTTFTTGQLHRILVRPSEEGIRKVLRRLTKQGIVQSDRVGNAYAYRLNRDHLAADCIIGLARLQETLLSRLKSRLESWEVPPIYAAVFGSAARGSMTAESDLDLLLIRPHEVHDVLWETHVNDLVSDMNRWLGNDVRPLQFTGVELASRGADEPVLQSVLEEGLTVAGSRTWLARHLRREKD